MFNFMTSSAALQRSAQLTSSPSRAGLAVCVGVPAGVTAVGIAAFPTREAPRCFGLSAERMKAAGFNALLGDTFVVARADGPVFVATRAGEPDELDTDRVRDAAALMCADDVPSTGRRALGSVITMRGGRTVEVTRADADGRLVLCDGLALAAEDGHDAIIDIGTVTSSIVSSLSPDMAGLFGNDAGLLRQIRTAAQQTGESVWQLPLHRPYRKVLDSDIASIRNAEPVDAAYPEGLISAICLAEFVGSVPWAHIDICGTASRETDQLWRRAGGSGFGARLLVEVVSRFRPG